MKQKYSIQSGQKMSQNTAGDRQLGCSGFIESIGAIA